MLTGLAHRLGRWVYAATGGHALAQSVPVAIVVVGAAITLLDVDDSAYLAVLG